MGGRGNDLRLRQFPPRRIEAVFFRALRGSFRALTPISPALASRWAEFLFRTPLRSRRTRKELAWLARGQFASIPFRGGRLACWRWGQGPRILLVHGWTGHAGRLIAYVPALVEAGFSVTAFDAPGHGLSSGWQSSLPDFADAVEAVALAKGPIEGIVAHSLGAAAVTLAIARGLAVARAVFISPATDPDQYSGRFARILRISASVRESMKKRLELRYRVPWSRFRVIECTDDITASLLIFHDRGDSKVPFVKSAAFARAWGGARLVETRGLGHHKILRDPGVVFGAVAFLSRDLPPAETLAADSPPAS